MGRITGPDGRGLKGVDGIIQRYIDLAGWIDVVKGGVSGADGDFRYCRLERGANIRVIASYPGASDTTRAQTLSRKLTIVTMSLQPKR